MVVTFLKKHLEYEPGQSVEIADETAAYWLRVGVATLSDLPNEEEIEETLTTKLKKTKKKK